MSKFSARLLATSMAVGLCMWSANSQAANLNLCGGSPGGLWSLLGAGLDAAAKASDPNTTITYQTSSGGYANVVQVTKNKCDLGIIHVGEGVQANKGRTPFKSPVSDFRVLMIMYDWAPMQWIATKAFADKHGIKSLADIKAKKPAIRLILNRRGILPSQLGELNLKAAGVTLDDIKKWGGKIEFQGSKNASEIMQNGRADLWANAVFVGSGKIRQAAKSVPLTLLQVPQVSIDAAVKEFGAQPWTIKAGGYAWQKEPIKTHAARAVLIVAKDMPDDKAYALTKAVIKNSAKVQGVHKAMKGFTPKLMGGLTELPYHAGAIKAYKEAGVMK
ncbi:MAG: TAXI family TRAP transporter solute-binding subunit [Hyphomicrobiaceae bacterium]